MQRMSPESEKVSRGKGSPVALISFTLSLLIVANPVFVYLFIVAWVVPLLLAGVFALCSKVAGGRSVALKALVDGALAATVFCLALYPGLVLGGAIVHWPGG